MTGDPVSNETGAPSKQQSADGGELKRESRRSASTENRDAAFQSGGAREGHERDEHERDQKREQSRDMERFETLEELSKVEPRGVVAWLFGTGIPHLAARFQRELQALEAQQIIALRDAWEQKNYGENNAKNTPHARTVGRAGWIVEFRPAKHTERGQANAEPQRVESGFERHSYINRLPCAGFRATPGCGNAGRRRQRPHLRRASLAGPSDGGLLPNAFLPPGK